MHIHEWVFMHQTHSNTGHQHVVSKIAAGVVNLSHVSGSALHVQLTVSLELTKLMIEV